MADKKRNIDINIRTNADEAKVKIDGLNKSVEDTTKSTDSLTDSITSNGGAMSVLDSVTGGYASRLKDAYEASNVFKRSTDGMTVSQRAYNAVVGTSTGSLKTFRLALAATGIGAIIVLLGVLIANWDRLTGALNRAEKAQIEVNRAINQGTINVNKESVELLRLTGIARDETNSKEARLAAIKAINEISPEYLGNISLETIRTEETTDAINNYIEALGRKMQAQALERAIQSTYDDELESRSKSYTRWYDSLLTAELQMRLPIERQLKELEDILAQRESLENQLQEMMTSDTNLIGSGNQEVMDEDFAKYVENEQRKIDRARNRGEDVDELESAFLQRKISHYEKDSEEHKKAVKDFEDFNDRLAAERRRKGENASQERIQDAQREAERLKRIEEETTRRLEEEGKKRKEILDKIRGLEVEMMNDPSDKAIAEKESKVTKIYEDWGEAVSKLRDIIIDDDVFDESVKTIDEYYEGLVKETENTYDVLYKKTLDVKDLFENIGTGDASPYYDTVSDILGIFESMDDGAVKDALSKVYDIPALKENLNNYQALVKENQEFSKNEILNPANNPEDGWVLTSLFGKGGTQEALAKIKEFYDNQRALIDSQESEELKLAKSEEEITAIKQKYSNKRMQIDREEAEANKRLNDERIKQQLDNLDSYSSALDAASQLMSEHTAGHKILAIASATIDTYTSAVAAYNGMTKAIPGPVGIAAGIAAASSSILMGLNNVNEIRKVKVPGGESGGGGGSNPFSQPNVDFVSSSENQIANTVGDRMQSNNEPIKAYVVSSEISTSQSLERNKIESNSL